MNLVRRFGYFLRLCSDYAHSLDIRTQPQVESMFTIRLEQQNVLATIQRWNEELLNEVSVKESRKVVRELIFVNEVKHREPQISNDEA